MNEIFNEVIFDNLLSVDVKKFSKLFLNTVYNGFQKQAH